MRKAEIRAFGRKYAHPPAQRRSYNDDVRVEAYKPAELTYAGKQRREIRENFVSLSSTEDHVHRALREQFPLSVGTPLPHDTKDDAVSPR